MSDNISTREQCIQAYASVIEKWFCDHELPVCDNFKFAEMLHDARLKMVGPGLINVIGVDTSEH